MLKSLYVEVCVVTHVSKQLLRPLAHLYWVVCPSDQTCQNPQLEACQVSASIALLIVARSCHHHSRVAWNCGAAKNVRMIKHVALRCLTRSNRWLWTLGFDLQGFPGRHRAPRVPMRSQWGAIQRGRMPRMASLQDVQICRVMTHGHLADGRSVARLVGRMTQAC